MYYLVIENLGVQRCIHRSRKDQYGEGISFSCTPDLKFPGGELVKEVFISCTEVPDPPVRAKVYRK